MFLETTSFPVAWKTTLAGIGMVLVRAIQAITEGMSCAVMTAEFLAFSKKMGNDLSTPVPAYNFPGLQPGDCWCLCAGRWQEALEAGMAPKVKLEACEQSALEVVSLADLQAHAV